MCEHTFIPRICSVLSTCYIRVLYRLQVPRQVKRMVNRTQRILGRNCFVPWIFVRSRKALLRASLKTRFELNCFDQETSYSASASASEWASALAWQLVTVGRLPFHSNEATNQRLSHKVVTLSLTQGLSLSLVYLTRSSREPLCVCLCVWVCVKELVHVSKVIYKMSI